MGRNLLDVGIGGIELQTVKVCGVASGFATVDPWKSAMARVRLLSVS